MHVNNSFRLDKQKHLYNGDFSSIFTFPTSLAKLINNGSDFFTALDVSNVVRNIRMLNGCGYYGRNGDFHNGIAEWKTSCLDLRAEKNHELL